MRPSDAPDFGNVLRIWHIPNSPISPPSVRRRRATAQINPNLSATSHHSKSITQTIVPQILPKPPKPQHPHTRHLAAAPPPRKPKARCSQRRGQTRPPNSRTRSVSEALTSPPLPPKPRRPQRPSPTPPQQPKRHRNPADLPQKPGGYARRATGPKTRRSSSPASAPRSTPGPCASRESSSDTTHAPARRTF